MKFESINPFTGELLAKFQEDSDAVLQNKIENAHVAFNQWRSEDLKARISYVLKVGELLKREINELALLITNEMGKPIKESMAEINKCAWLCNYYAENAEDFLRDEIIETDALKSYVKNDPLGVILGIMPWNFPFWQVFRFAIPALTVGNTVILKHAPNVFGCAKAIEEIFIKAGIYEGVFQSVYISVEKSEQIISHPYIKAVSLTGSERAGSAVAALCGKYLKKTVLELGGNNAFIVLQDADIDRTVHLAITARMLNAGQSCIAAKRFLIDESIYDAFTTKFIAEIKKLKSGNPSDETVQVGPLARIDLADNLKRQIDESVRLGAVLKLGGKQNNCFVEPTVLENVQPGMPAFDEETFGPLVSFIKFKNIEEAIQLSEMSKYGLGVTICTSDITKAESLFVKFSDGAFFINDFVKSDPRLPFGGTKNSGYGRELGKDGIMEFVNRKTVYIKE